jgi:hypothetical protein
LADHVEGVGTGADVVGVLAASLEKVLVAGDTGSLKSRGGDLFLLVRHKVRNEREHINTSPLGAAVEDPDLGVGDTAAETRLNIRLVLLEAAATSGA